MKIAKDITLLISTYNKPDYLRLVLEAVSHQIVMPAEIVIADDGSGEDTRKTIDNFRSKIPVPIIHSWIPDKGFRKTKALNTGIAKASKEYIICIDGDIVIMPYFVMDHETFKEKGCFVAGSRAYLNEKATKTRIKTEDINFTFFSAGLKRRFVILRIPFLCRIIKGHKGLSRARGCHLAFWREDCIKVNGFEENMTGWGFEDSEFVQRLFNNGIIRKNIKLKAGAIHLYHKELSRKDAPTNRDFLAKTISMNKKVADKGIDQYL